MILEYLKILQGIGPSGSMLLSYFDRKESISLDLPAASSGESLSNAGYYNKRKETCFTKAWNKRDTSYYSNKAFPDFTYFLGMCEVNWNTIQTLSNEEITKRIDSAIKIAELIGV